MTSPGGTRVDSSEVHCPEIVREAWKAAGYRLRRTCYASKHTRQHPGMARWNNIARKNRAPIADIFEVLTFVTGRSSNTSSDS